MKLLEAAQMVDCGGLLHKAGIKGCFTGNGRGIWMCPFHDAAEPSLVTYPSIEHFKSKFYCFRCRRYGGAIELYQQIKGIRTPGEAAKALCRAWRITYAGTTPRGVMELQYDADEDPRLLGIRTICSKWKNIHMQWYGELIEQSRTRYALAADGGEKTVEEQRLAHYGLRLRKYQEMTEWEVLHDICRELELLGVTPYRRLRIAGYVT